MIFQSIKGPSTAACVRVSGNTRGNFGSSIGQLLNTVCGTANSRTADNEELFRELLESRAILQYVNADEWYGQNPMIAANVAATNGGIG